MGIWFRRPTHRVLDDVAYIVFYNTTTNHKFEMLDEPHGRSYPATIG